MAHWDRPLPWGEAHVPTAQEECPRDWPWFTAASGVLLPLLGILLPPPGASSQQTPSSGSPHPHFHVPPPDTSLSPPQHSSRGTSHVLRAFRPPSVRRTRMTVPSGPGFWVSMFCWPSRANTLCTEHGQRYRKNQAALRAGSWRICPCAQGTKEDTGPCLQAALSWRGRENGVLPACL